MKKLLLATALLTASFPVLSSNDVIHDALGFMIGGDQGWSGKNNYKVEGCTASYELTGLYLRATVKYDFSKANYKTARYTRQGISEWFLVQGNSGVQEVSVLPVGRNGSWNRHDVIDEFGMLPGAQNMIGLRLKTTRARFKKALTDLKKECPGIQSKY